MEQSSRMRLVVDQMLVLEISRESSRPTVVVEIQMAATVHASRLLVETATIPAAIAAPAE